MTTTEDLNRQLWTERAAGRADRSWESIGTEPPGLGAEPVELPGGPGLWLRPPGADDERVVLAIHGGGFVSGSITTHRRMFGHLARAAGVATLLVDYGLVPEHVYPSQLDQVEAAYRTLHGRRIVVAGDSCGATLALGLALRARDHASPAPKGLLLFSAWAGLEATGDSYDTGSDPFFTRELVTGLAVAYLAGADPSDPVANPVQADLRGLPPTYLQAGAEESLLDDSRVLAARMAEAGAEVRLDEFEGQLHTFQMAAGHSPVADEAIGRAGTWVRERLAT